jgi:hypothetical protein
MAHVENLKGRYCFMGSLILVNFNYNSLYHILNAQSIPIRQRKRAKHVNIEKPPQSKIGYAAALAAPAAPSRRSITPHKGIKKGLACVQTNPFLV